MFFLRVYLLPYLVKIGSPRFRRFIVGLLPFQNVQRLRSIVDVMYNTSIEILDAKKRALEEGDDAVSRQIGKGKDIISILSMCIRMLFPWPAYRHIYSSK